MATFIDHEYLFQSGYWCSFCGDWSLFVLVWYCLFLASLMVLLFLIPIRSIYHARTNIKMVQNDMDPNNNSGMQRFSHLDIPTKYQYWPVLKIGMPSGRVLCYHYWCWLYYWYLASTYIPDQDWSLLNVWTSLLRKCEFKRLVWKHLFKCGWYPRHAIVS